MFYVVQFEATRDVDIIPQEWMVGNSHARWPDKAALKDLGLNPGKIRKLVETRHSNVSGWPIYQLDGVKKCGMLQYL